MELTFLSPRGALVVIGVLVPLVALFLIRRRAGKTRHALGVAPPPRSTVAVAVIAVVATGGLLGLAAAQPVVERLSDVEVRTDAEGFVVIDVSRSMLARQNPSSPTRLARAKAVARSLRAELPELRMGVASLTDRTLPHLFPSSDQDVFDATVDKSLDIEQPPPRSSIATTVTQLDSLTTVRTHRYFDRDVDKRLLVVLTDGESQPVSGARLGELFRRDPPIDVLFVHLWDANERVFSAGAPEPQYEPDPSAREVLDGLANLLSAQVYTETELVAAADKARELVGSGPTVVHGRRSGEIALAPFMAAAALAPLALLLARRDR